MSGTDKGSGAHKEVKRPASSIDQNNSTKINCIEPAKNMIRCGAEKNTGMFLIFMKPDNKLPECALNSLML